jgi:hypothetical protein
MTTPAPPDDAHRRPAGVSDAVVEATGKLSEALEWIERARGRLYDLHQLVGRADFLVGDASDLFEEAGHPELAARLREEIVGRNVLPGRWTFQIVEEFDDGYWGPIREVEREIREQLVGGRRHLFEAEMKEQRRTQGQPRHESRP